METAYVAAALLLVLVIHVSSESLGYEGCWSGDDVAGSGLPWHASIFLQLEEVPGTFQYQCAGVLVTDRHLLIDMFGLKGEGPYYLPREPSKLFVSLGAATASWDPDAPGVVISKVSRVLVDDSYTSNGHTLAMLELEVPLVLTDSVRPICVDSSDQPQEGDTAFVAVPDSNKNLALKLQKLKFASVDECIGDSRYAYVTDTKFCADSSDEAVCRDAMGSGLVWRSSDGRWLLKGVVSENTVQNGLDGGHCVAGYQVFNGVDSHLPLLRSFLLSSCYSGRPSPAPWHAQLYLRAKERRGYEYACSAVLLSHRYLLTGGSCFEDKAGNNLIDISRLVVALGRKVKNLQTEDTGSQILEVSRVELQDGGQGLAIVELDTPAALGDDVAAVCLNTEVQQTPPAGAPGVVATFTPLENSALKLLYVNVVDSDKCLAEKPELKTVLTANKFCAADKKAAVCPGNEGSALLTRTPDRGGWWALRGILAPMPQPSNGDDGCTKGSAVFTLVDHSIKWILDTLLHLSVPRSLLKPEKAQACWSGRAGNSPWHALVHRQQRRLDWFDLKCAGTIVSKRHVVTDAACFWDATSRNITDLSKLKITAGKKTREWTAEESDVQIREIAEVLLQPGYQGDASSEAVVAVALLKIPLDLSDAVRPVCIDGSPLQEGQIGLVPSLDLRRLSELQILNMNVMKKNECLAELTTNTCWTMASNKFCAIDRKVSEGLCPGNAGAGLVTRGPGGEWLLKGVASRRQVRRKNRECSKETVFFTAVEDSHQWLSKVLQGSTSFNIV